MTHRQVATSLAVLERVFSGKIENSARGESFQLSESPEHDGLPAGPVHLRRLGLGVYALQPVGQTEPDLVLLSRRRHRRVQ